MLAILVLIVKSGRRGMHPEELSTALGPSTGTVRRRLEELCAHQLLEQVHDGRFRRRRLSQKVLVAALGLDGEISRLSVALLLEGLPELRDSSAVDVLRCLLAVDASPRAEKPAHEMVADVVMHALATHRTLRFNYLGEVQLAVPLRVRARGGYLQLDARSLSSGGLRRYWLALMVKPSSRPSGTVNQRATPARARSEPPLEATVHLRHDVVSHLADKPMAFLSGDRLPDGNFEVTVRGTMNELVHWVLSWGSSAKVLRPASVRRAVRMQARAFVE